VTIITETDHTYYYHENMYDKRELKAIFILSVVGLLFSGYLSFTDLLAKGCFNNIGRCLSTHATFDLPLYIYVLIMHFIVFVISLSGIKRKSTFL
jgi:uncharacterized protein (DUF983 family)